MHTQIRLAERQGLLRGRHINNVQQRALLLLDSVDRIEHRDALQRELHRMVNTMGFERFAETFPQHVAPPEETPVDEDEIDAVLEADGAVRYEAGTETMTEERMKQLLNSLMADSASGSFSGARVREEGWV